MSEFQSNDFDEAGMFECELKQEWQSSSVIASFNHCVQFLMMGTIDKRFFEFNIVNHFLKEKNGDAAVEVVACMLIEWCKENKDIKNFDIDIIDAELAKIEKEYLEKQKKEKEAEKEKLSSEINCN